MAHALRIPNHRRSSSGNLAYLIVAGAVLFLLAAGCGRPTADLPPTPTFQVSGALTRDGQPVRNASVHLEGTPLGAVVDDRGEFRIGNVRGGTHRLSVIYLGYHSEPVVFTVPGGGGDGTVLLLKPDAKYGPPLAGDDPQLLLSYRVSGGS